VARCWVGDRVTRSPVSSIGQLEKGQGAVLRVRGKEIAAYRDEGEQVYTLSRLHTFSVHRPLE
jgi:hypothetical protein